MSVLDKRRQAIKQQDGAEDRNVEQDGGVENTAAQTEQDEGLTIFRYCSVHPSKHDFCFPGITYDSFFY